MRRTFPIAALLCALALAAALPAAGRPEKNVDLVWVAPDFASFGVHSIALLPVVTYDGSVEARRTVESGIVSTFPRDAYRWVSPIVSRDEIVNAGGDSLLKALGEPVLKVGRLDSLAAPACSRLLHVRALLTVRVDQFEKRELRFDESGKPTTTIQIHAALVDSTGRLLWSASGTENAEGPYQDPSTNPIGVNASGLNNQPITNQGGAPSFQETLRTLLARIVASFPGATAGAGK